MFDKQYRAILQAKNQHDAIGTTFDLWRFTSKKTNKEYVVLMEKYHDNVYGVKFYLRQHRKDKDKFSKMTGYGEASTIIKTIISVMLEYATSNPSSSFVVIGALGKNEEQTLEGSKRYKIYKNIIRQLINDKNFYHYDFPDRNMYMLLRKSEVDSGNIGFDGCVEFIDTIS